VVELAVKRGRDRTKVLGGMDLSAISRPTGLRAGCLLASHGP
jgi:hypothetical protein